MTPIQGKGDASGTWLSNLGLKARDIIGYTTLQFVVHVPLVLFLVWILNYTLQYVAPALP
jgi:short-chain fatty acids transporter